MPETNIALLFDMDGVLVDNMAYHKESWLQFCNTYGISLTEEQMLKYVNGRTAKDILDYLFERNLMPEETIRLTEEKEEAYRLLYRPHIQPTTGLIPFLDELKAHNVPMAVATSAPKSNIDFTLVGANIKEYFTAIADASMVKKGKPDPEIYLKAAQLVGAEPRQCVVIEDALSGIQAGLRAGMTVIGITTTHTSDELRSAHPHRLIKDFTELNYAQLQALVEENTHR